jgi:uncharacterized protein
MIRVDFMAGMNRVTGQLIDGWPLVRQSIIDIISTRVGTRLTERTYGCHFASAIDQPGNQTVLAALMVAIADALRRDEPRFRPRRTNIYVAQDQAGAFEIDLLGDYYPNALEGDFSVIEAVDEFRFRVRA